MKRVAALPLLLAIACTGSVSGGNGAQGPGGGAGGPGSPGGPGNPGGPGGPGTPGGSNGPGGAPSTGACDASSIPRVRTWRLTTGQLRNTLQAVFGFAGPSTDGLPQDGQPDGFASQADRLSVPPLLASRLMVATDEVAANVLGRSAEFLQCPLDALGTGTCLRDFLTTTGARAWRRPLTPAEVAKYTALYTRMAGASGPAGGFRSVVQTLLLSPNFLFRTELGDGQSSGATTALTHHELASALSYMLTDSPPDAPLMALADQGKLRDPATLAAEARRLLGAAPARQIVGSFFAQWLQFDGLPALTKDASLFPMYTPEVVKDLLGESQALIDAVLFDPAGEQSVKGLFTADYAFVNSRIAPLYGVQASGAALVKTPLPTAQRRGLLTQAAFIGAASDSDDTNLPARGRIVREQALCATVAPPPADFQLEDAKITPDMTNREKFIVHTTNPACAACHAMFDGIGYAMEQYDAIGRFRTMDKAKTIDATGSLPLPSGTLTFTGYVDLIDQIAKLPGTYECVASRFDAYATGRAPGDIPACESDPITKAFASSGYRLDALVAAIVSSPNFALRRN
jgi:hypothetical protein